MDEKQSNDFDEVYYTKLNSAYSDKKLGFIFGPLFLFLGLISIIVTIVELFRGIYNQDLKQNNNEFIYTWDENPFWPSYAKGFWVGLIVRDFKKPF